MKYDFATVVGFEPHPGFYPKTVEQAVDEYVDMQVGRGCSINALGPIRVQRWRSCPIKDSDVAMYAARVLGFLQEVLDDDTRFGCPNDRLYPRNPQAAQAAAKAFVGWVMRDRPVLSLEKVGAPIEVNLSDSRG